MIGSINFLLVLCSSYGSICGVSCGSRCGFNYTSFLLCFILLMIDLWLCMLDVKIMALAIEALLAVTLDVAGSGS